MGLAKAVRSVVAALLLGASPATASGRDLDFSERVRAEEALLRLRYSHMISATRPFEAVVRVRESLARALALERRRGRPVTARQLRGELERIVSDSQAPERLARSRRGT